MGKVKPEFIFQLNTIASELIQLGKAENNFFPEKNAARVVKKMTFVMFLIPPIQVQVTW